MNRTFLEWGPAPLDRAAQALVQTMGAHPGPWWFVLPGRRAVRKFQGALARHLPATMEPPRGISQGAWLEVFRPLTKPAIDRREAVHVWAAELRALSGADWLRAFGQEKPAPDAAGAFWMLGQRARDLHVEMCQAGIDFADVAKGVPAQKNRWMVWQDMLDRYLGALASQGLCDGHQERNESSVLDGVRLAWIFVPTSTRLERSTLELLGDRCHTFVLCPDSLAGRFDPFGAVLADGWIGERLPIQKENWFVENTPRDQADRVGRILRDWSEAEGVPLASSDVVLSAPDQDLKPFLVRGLQRVGLELRDGAGTDLAGTPVALLLQALGRMLPDMRFHEVARVLRHPDLLAALQGPVVGKLGEGEVEVGDSIGNTTGVQFDVPAAMDAYHERHLPMGLLDPVPGDSTKSQPAMQALDRLRSELGALSESALLKLSDWAPVLRKFLSWVYGPVPLDPALESDRAVLETLQALGQILSRWETSEASWMPTVSGAGAIALCLGELAGQHMPPMSGSSTGEELELLGWHELLWDDAPALVLTGFNEGYIPEAVPDDALLPPALRRSLGLADSESRVIRDLYLMRCLLEVRERCALVSGRVSEEGEPLRPSRLAFHVSDDRIPDALKHAFPDSEDAHLARQGGEKTIPRALPLLASMPSLERIAITDFKRYLESPYLYYLERLLKLETGDDRDREMNAIAFGNLLHGVMEDFGNGSERHSQDAKTIEGVMQAALSRRLSRLFGGNALPAVQLQIQGLKRRLTWVAQEQALWAAQGWKIHSVEWSPEGDGVSLGAGSDAVTLVGRVDRIDHHPAHGYAILDFKTGDAPKDPDKDHRKGRGKERPWSNLQLPLYTHLVKELVGAEKVAVGYFNVGKERSAVQVQIAPWDSSDMETALGVAGEVVASIRADLARGSFEHNRSARTYDPVFAAILGETLVGETLIGASGEEGTEGASS